MKSKHLLTILPIIAVLTGCGQTELKLNQNAATQLAGPTLTATPQQLIVYPDDRPSIPDGKQTYLANCASCHSDTGSGGSSKFNFDADWAHNVRPVDLYRFVSFDNPKQHPTFANKLSPRELWNVVVYTRSLGQPALTDAQISAIDPVFGSNCAVCHGTKGDGEGPLARNLDPQPANFQRFDRFFNRTDNVLFDHIANGIRWEGMPNFLGKKDSKKNVKFDEAYIAQLVQYVHKFHVNNNPVLAISHGGTPDTLSDPRTPNPAPADGSAGSKSGNAPSTGTAGASNAQGGQPAATGTSTGSGDKAQSRTSKRPRGAR